MIEHEQQVNLAGSDEIGTKAKRPRDAQRAKVYAAEWEAFKSGPHDNRIPDLDVVRRICEEWVGSSWFRATFPQVESIRVCDGRGRRRPCGFPFDVEGEGGTMKFPRFARKRWLLCHELAHVVTSVAEPSMMWYTSLT